MQGLRLQQRITGGLEQPPRTRARFTEIAAASVLAFFVVCAVWVSFERGPWLDELWSLWQAQHDVPLGQIAAERWMADFHPPLFSFVHWLFEPFIADSLAAHRLLNLLPLAWATLFALALLRRFPDAVPVVLVLSVLTLSLPAPLEYFAESRSYFAQLCLTFALVAAAIAILGSGADLDRGRDWPLAGVLAATIVVALNLHYTTSLLLGLMLFGLAGLAAVRGQRRWALVVALPAALGCLALLATVAAQRPFLDEASSTFWVQGDLGAAFVTLLRYFARAVKANPVAASACAVAILVTAASMLRPHARSLARRLVSHPVAGAFVLPAAQRPAVLLFALTALAFVGGMLIVHAWRPIVIGKYILTYQIVTAGIVACLAAPLARWRWLFALLAAATLLSLALTASVVGRQQRWDASTRAIVQLQAHCPSSPVHAAVPPSKVYSRNATTALRWSYRQQAAWHGFAVRDFDLEHDAVPRPAGPCPALLWIEHVALDKLPLARGPAALLEHYGLPATGIDLSRAKLYTGESGFVLQLPFE